MTIKICDVATNIVVIRIGAESVDYVTSAIPFIVCIGPEAAVLMTHFIGSSIRSCEKKLLQINRDQLHVKFASAKTPQEKQFIQKAICATTGNAGMKAAERITVCLTELFGPKQ
ncbi:hypothetical protein L596_023536 [Steinernema carpocapsae]|uniref:Ribonuclease P/MRP protein subunit POP5 n=1 Tax=Steinernema carpocapsae TaxID=34508 RepID=A0A4U5ME03_STECR|nr:hypothetical protein L596_023536 [Steinernema carpocapsae]